MNNSPVSILSCYRLLLSSYRQTWFSLTMVGLSLLIACAGLSAVLLINQGAKQSYTGQTATQLLPAQHQVIAINNSDSKSSFISTEDYASIKSMGLSKTIAVAESLQHLYMEQTRLSERRVMLIGLDFLSLLNQSQVKRSSDQALPAYKETKPETSYLSGTLSFASPATFLHPRFMQELGIDEQSTLSIKNNNQENFQTLPPLIAFSERGISDALIVDIGILLDLDPKASISRILLLDGITPRQIEKLKENLPSHLKLEAISAQQNDPQMTQSFYLNLFAMALLMFAVCLFIVMNAFNLLISKRFSMLKVCRQLGIGRQQIILAHAIEFSIFAIVICAVGVILGGQLALVLSPTIRSIVEGLYRVQLGFADTPWVALYAKVLLISMAGIALALLSPLKQLNSSLSSTQEQSNEKHINIVVGAMCIILAVIATIIFSFSSLLGALLLGAAFVILSGCCALILLFPQSLYLLFNIVGKRFTLTRLSIAQASFLSRKTKIACCAFFIAATSNLGMNLMVDSFRASTESWLAQRLVADHYLYSNDQNSKGGLQNLAKQSGVQLFPRFEQSITFNNNNVQLFSYPAQAQFQQAMVFESSTNDVWQGFQAGENVLINQQLAIRAKLQLNDNISLVHPITQTLQNFTVGGIIYDYGNTYGQILLDASQFNEDFRQASIFAVMGDATSVGLFREGLQSLGIDANSQMYETAAILSSSMAVFDRTFVITDSLNLVTLLVAALSLACTIIILLEQSRPQTMLLRAMGVSAWQSRRILMQQYLFLCAVALLSATPFGILLSYVLIEQINYHAFNWSYPLIIDWINILKLYVLSLLVVVVIISLPIVYTTKNSLAQELKWLD